MTPPTVPPAVAVPLVHLNLIAAAIVHLNLVAVAGAAAGAAAAANQLNATSPVSTNDVAFCFLCQIF